jgi:hypothetical protein
MGSRTRQRADWTAVPAAAAVVLVVMALEAPPIADAVAPMARPASVVDCNVYAYFPNLLISSARNMSCRQAVRDMRRYRRSISRRFTTPGGFACVRVSGGDLGGQWRCTNGSRAYRFDFGD